MAAELLQLLFQPRCARRLNTPIPYIKPSLTRSTLAERAAAEARVRSCVVDFTRPTSTSCRRFALLSAIVSWDSALL